MQKFDILLKIFWNSYQMNRTLNIMNFDAYKIKRLFAALELHAKLQKNDYEK